MTRTTADPPPPSGGLTRPHRTTGLWALFAIQAFCASFFLVDAVKDWLGLDNTPGLRHVDTFEMLVALCLIAGMIVTGFMIRGMARRQAALRTRWRLRRAR